MINSTNKEKIETNEFKLRCQIEKIKNDFFKEKVFNNLHKKRLLKIIKHNKKANELLNLKINSYKECCETYSTIEIEIKPTKDKYSKFINIKEERDKSFYHIYFNNNKKEEIERNYLNSEDKVTIIHIIIDYQVKSFKELFYNCQCIESIYFRKFYRNNIINMERMFSNCSSLKELNLSNFNTNSVTNMSGIFSKCISLKELNLSNFNTINVTDMTFMFSENSSLIKLDISNFNTNNVTNMMYMFYGCSSLKEINIPKLNIKNVTTAFGMLPGCSEEIKTKIVSQLTK